MLSEAMKEMERPEDRLAGGTQGAASSLMIPNR